MCLGLEEERLQGCSCQQSEVPASPVPPFEGGWDMIIKLILHAGHTAQRPPVDAIHGGTNSDKPAIINAMQCEWNRVM